MFKPSIYGGADSYLETSSNWYFSTGTIVAVPLDNNDGLSSIIALTLCKAPYIAIAIIDDREKEILGLRIVPNTLRSSKKNSCIELLNWLKDSGVRIVAVPRTDRTFVFFNKLEELGMDFIFVDPGLSLKEVLEQFFI